MIANYALCASYFDETPYAKFLAEAELGSESFESHPEDSKVPAANEPAELLKAAGRAWRDQQMSLALELYWAAFQRSKTSIQTAQPLISFLLIWLSNLYGSARDPGGRKRAIRAFLHLQPGNEWAARALFELARNPYDRSAVRHLTECVSSWGPELRIDMTKRVQALTENPLPTESQALLLALTRSG